MNRRNFLKTVPAIAAGITAAPLALANKAPASSIMMLWTYPGRWGCESLGWNTPTTEHYRRAKEAVAARRADLVAEGCKVQVCEFDVLRFCSANELR